MGRQVVVTGGASGIGRRIAEILLGEGEDVFVLDRDEDRLKAGQADLQAQFPDARVDSMICDVAETTQIEQFAEELAARGWQPQTLICAAGWSPNRPFADLRTDEIEQIVRVNLLGVLHLCRVLHRPLTRAQRGRIVLISSDAARIGTPKETVYAAAKAGLHAFAKALAVEVARDGVTVNVVSPGSTDTPMLRSMLTDEQIAKRIRANPMKRLATPDDIAQAAVFFCRESSGYITGQILSVNGGMTRVD